MIRISVGAMTWDASAAKGQNRRCCSIIRSTCKLTTTPGHEMTTADINRFFDICQEHKLEPAQPSLMPHSPVMHPLVFDNTLSRSRFTDFVEVMAFCFSASCLRKVLPALSMTWSSAMQGHSADRITMPCALRGHRLPTIGNVSARSGDIDMIRIEIRRVLWRSGQLEDVRDRSLSFAITLGLGYLRALIASPARWQLLFRTGSLINRPFEGSVAFYGATL